MPVTFFAHQGPLLPLTRRWPNAVDGIALMAGTMTPDLAWVLVGTRLEVRSHEFPAAITVCVPMAVVIALLIGRLLAPIVPDHLPQTGPLKAFDLVSYRGLATHRFGLLRTPIWAVVGTVSHVGLDQFTHEWGWASRNVAWYSNPLVETEVAGLPITPFRIAEWIGHVGLSLLSIGLLLSYGRSGWMRTRAALVPVADTTAMSHLVLWGMTIFGAVIASAVGSIGNPPWVVVFMRVLGGAFGGMCLGALVLGRSELPPSSLTEPDR